MKEVQYFIRSLQVDLATPTERQNAEIHIRMSMGEPNLDDDILQTKGTIDVVLAKIGSDTADADSIDDIEAELGEISIETIIQLHTQNIKFDSDLSIEEEMDVWREEGYAQIHPSLISKIESGIVPEIFVPVNQLIGNSVQGLIPRFRLTPGRGEVDTETV